MKIRSAIIAATLATAFAGVAQAGYYGYRAHGYTAPVYTPVCGVEAKRVFVYGYGWVYRDVRVCR